MKNELLLLYARYNRVSNSERQNIANPSDINTERNKINLAMIDLIGKMR